MVDNSNDRSAIGQQPRSDTPVNYNVMPEQVTRQLQSAQGSTFVLIHQVRQSDEPQIWSSGDRTQTEKLFQQAYATTLQKETTS